MKKTLFVLLAALLVLGAFSVALADDFNTVCPTCGDLLKANVYVACDGTAEEVHYCPTCDVGAGITPGSATVPHDWDDGEVTAERTCVSRGVRKYTCRRCGATKEEYDAPTGHRYGTYNPTKNYTIGRTDRDDGVTVISMPSCTITGTYSLSCLNRCGLESGVEYGTIPAVGHLYNCPTLTPNPRRMDTVVEQALIAYGARADITPAIFATRTKGNSKEGLYIAANCVHEGYINVYCVVCDNLHKIVIPKTTHRWDPNHTQTTNSTCIKYGTSTRICVVCAQIVTENLPLAGHTWIENGLTHDEWFKLSATLKYKKCGVCNRIETYRITGRDSSDELIGVTNGTKAENIGTLTAGNPTITQPNNRNTVAKASTSAAKASASSTKANASGVSIPKTNDNTSTLPFVMMGIALVGIVALIASKRKVNG